MKIHFDYLVYAAYIQQSLCRDASPTFLCVVRTQRLQIIPKPFVRWMVNPGVIHFGRQKKCYYKNTEQNSTRTEAVAVLRIPKDKFFLET